MTATTDLRRRCFEDLCPHCKAGCPTAPEGVTVDTAYELDPDVRHALPPQFHQPMFEGLATPTAWLCAVCWDDGQVTRWPCHVASAHGPEVAEAIGARWTW